MNKKNIAVTLTIISVFVLVFIGWWFWQKQTVKLTNFTHNQGISFKYPIKMDVQTISEQDKKDKFLFKATQPKGVPPLSITLRYEEGLRKLANLSKQEPIDLLANNTRLAYPKRFPSYREVNQRQLDIKGHKAAEYIFTYQNKGETLKQQFLIIIKDDDTAFYMAFQAKTGDFDKLSKKYFTPIINSIAIN